MSANERGAFFVVENTASTASRGEETIDGFDDPEGGEDGEDKGRDMNEA